MASKLVTGLHGQIMGVDKWISVAKLRELLAKVPDDFEVSCNQVGNLYLGKPSFDKDGKPVRSDYAGFIDINGEELVLNEEGEGEDA